MDHSKMVPKRPKDIYIDKIGDFFYLYNPRSTKGVTVLTPQLFYYYSFIDGKSSFKHIVSLLHDRLPTTDDKMLEKIYGYFASREVIILPRETEKNIVPSNKAETLLVWFHITNQCNLRCAYCWVKKNDTKIDGAMLKASLDKIIPSAGQKGFKSVRINFGGGEPLLELASIRKTVSYANRLAKTAGITISYSVTTNATLLTAKLCKDFKKENISVAVSLDGLERFNNLNRKYVNGMGTFNHIMPGLLAAHKEGILDGVLITVTKNNVKHVPRIVSFLISKRIYKFRLQLFLDNANAEKDLKPDEKTLLTSLKRSYDLAYKGIPSFSLENSILYQLNLTQPKIACEAGKSFITVLPDGKITACSYDLETPIASVSDKDLFATLEKNNNIVSVLQQDADTGCKTCRWKYVCTSCPVFFGNKRNDYCTVFQEMIPYILKLEASRLIKEPISVSGRQFRSS